MPWKPLSRIAFAVATYPFTASSPADLPLEIGDELYIIEQGGKDGSWLRGYLVAPPSLLAGLTSVKGQTLEARVFSGVFPRCCVEIREVLGDGGIDENVQDSQTNGDSPRTEQTNGNSPRRIGSQANRSDSVRRNASNSSVEGRGAVMNGGDHKETPVGQWPKRTTSHKARHNANGHGLARKLSQRSITGSQARSSPIQSSPALDSPRDPAAKRPQAPVPMLKIGDETPTSSSEPLVDEIASCLREWHSKNLHELLLARHYSTIEKVFELVNRLDLARRQLLHGVLTTQELKVLREEIVWALVEGNKMLSNEVIVRDPKQHGRLLTANDSPIEITKLQSTMSLLDRSPVFQHDSVNLYHLLVDVKSFVNNGLILPILMMHLCSRSGGESPKMLTESFVVDLAAQEEAEQPLASGKHRTLFTDLTANDIGDNSRPDTQLYLVLRLQASQAIQKVLPSGPLKEKNDNIPLRRPPTSSNSTASSPKGGRQSIMWAQKQFGSVRNRSQDNRIPQTPSATIAASPTENGVRPVTQEGRPSTQQGAQYVKRNVGVGVVNLKNLFDHDVAGDQHVSFWSPSTTSSDSHSLMEEWDELVRELMPSRTGSYSKIKAMDHLRLALHSFTSPDAHDLVVKTPTLLQSITQTPKVDFPGAPTKARSDIYVRLCEAFLPHQALLSHPERGTVQLSSNLLLQNVQLTLEVRKKSGERIENCIFPGSNSAGQTAWRTSAVNRGEAWNQMIKLAIPTSDVLDAHLITSIADAPGFPFALSWMPLWDQEAFVKDGAHAPLLYLYDKVTSGSDNGRGAYLAFPWNSKGRYGDTKDETLTGPVATLKIETQLCSTYFSQDTVLLGILRWRDQRQNQILDLLKRLAFVSEIEIVKLVSDVFDALFGILVENAGKEDYEDAVFKALIMVLGIVHDRRFNLGPFVDHYAEEQFDHPFAAPCLIRSYLRLLSNPADASKSRDMRATFKVGRQILKFIICARKRQELKEADIGASTQSTFERDLKGIFHAFEVLIQDPSPTVVGSKTLVIQHMHTWLPELKAVFSERDIFNIVKSFLDACAHVQGKLVLYKLVLISNLTSAGIFTSGDVKNSVSASTVGWIDPYWGYQTDPTQRREQIRLCCSIVSKQASESQLDRTVYIYKAIQSYRSLLSPVVTAKEQLSLLFPVVYPFPSKQVAKPAPFDEALTELAGLLAILARDYIPKQGQSVTPERTDMLYDGLDMIMSILSGAAFPKTWLSLYVFHHKSSLQMLETLFRIMIVDFVPSPDDADDFNTELWSKFLLALLALVRSDTLALETFPEQKRRAVWKIAGDVREQGAALLKSSWEALGWEAGPDEQKRYGLSRLGGFQVQYVPTLVAPIVELCLSVHEGLRNVAVRILQAMIVSEWTLNEDLSVIQAEMIDCLETIFQSKNMGESILQKMFVNELLDLFESLARNPDDPMWAAVKNMISTVDELLELLAAVHSPDITETLKIMNTLHLMNFLKDLNKEDIFIRYVHQLAAVQSKLNNKTEAGLALRLHADLYPWESIRVRSLTDPEYPEQLAFERKEQLYFEMIRHLEEGEAWESALSSYRELADLYEHSQFDLAKLARTQRAMASIYDTVARGAWQPRRYFKVCYYGLGFPSSLKDKVFIYEGEPSERQTVFTDRIRQLHPAAQLVSKGDIDDMEGQYLQISPVSVYRDLEHPIYQQPKVVQSTRDFVSTSKPFRFAVTSKRHSPSSGVQDQYIEKTIYVTRESFPAILRRSEVVSTEEVRLSPLQTAVERTTRKTSELAALERKVGTGDDSAFQSLKESISSSIDPSSVATVAQYRQLLPIVPEEPDEGAEEGIERPAFSPLQNALQIALLDHVSMLKHCLTNSLRPNSVRPPASFSDNFHETFAPELSILAPAAPPIEEQPQYFSSPPSSFSGIPSSTVPKLILTNGGSEGETLATPRQPSESRPRPLSRISLGFLKTSGSSVPKSNGTASHPSAPSDDGSSSGRNLSQTGSSGRNLSHGGHSSDTHKSASGNTTAPLPPPTPSDDTNSERPLTAHSGRSAGRLKKRLSSLGIRRIGSSREGMKPDGKAMGGLAEE
ncbi:hypothetical protein MMC21_002490 [Puttea exsequens]|nr:hypothetical protein [Puttea exsequens]